MTPNELKQWKKLITSRLDNFKSHVEQTVTRLANSDQKRLPNDDVLMSAWKRVYDRFPEDFRPSRKGDLIRHMHFGHEHDFYDILNHDIPNVEQSVQEYGLNRNEVIKQELASLDFNIESWELLHREIHDACRHSFDRGTYSDTARKAVEVIMDEIRKRSGQQADGDKLIGQVVGVGKPIIFSQNENDNQHTITKGLKLMLQGAYKGIRNPASHGYKDHSRLEAFQIMVLCSFLMNNMRVANVD